MFVQPVICIKLGNSFPAGGRIKFDLCLKLRLKYEVLQGVGMAFVRNFWGGEG